MFFQQFPNTNYSIQNDAIQTNVKDYFRYVDVIDKLAQKSFSYQKVQVLDSERPDSLSLRLYGTTDYYWTFFIVNDFLKEGLSAWPKGDSEIKNHISKQFKDLSAFRFPVEPNLDGQGNRKLLNGIPILNKDYLPNLYLCKNIGIGTHGSLSGTMFAIGNIVDYDPDNALIWINTEVKDGIPSEGFYSTNKYLRQAPFDFRPGPGPAIEAEWTPLSKNKVLFENPTGSSYSIQFLLNVDQRVDIDLPGPDVAGTISSINGKTQAETIALRQQYIDELREVAIRFRPGGGYDDMSSDILDARYDFTPSQVFKDGALAPAHYYDPTDIEEEISQYDAAADSPYYVSNSEDILEQNEARKELKVVSPGRIQSFAREFKRLLNE